MNENALLPYFALLVGGYTKLAGGKQGAGGFVRNGAGTLTTKQNVVMSGNWKDDLLEGEGYYSFPPSDANAKGAVRYEGSFRAGRFEGRGKITWPDGSYYEGSFSNNKMSGQGAFTAPNGRVQYSGNWAVTGREGAAGAEIKLRDGLTTFLPGYAENAIVTTT